MSCSAFKRINAGALFHSINSATPGRATALFVVVLYKNRSSSICLDYITPFDQEILIAVSITSST